jgi:hypothetical protein
MFDLIYWKAAIKAYFPKAKEEFKAGVYTTLCAATFLPLLDATRNPAIQISAMVTALPILSELGGSLLANKLQEWLGQKDVSLEEMTDVLQASIQADELIRKKLDELLKQLETINLVTTNRSFVLYRQGGY